MGKSKKNKVEWDDMTYGEVYRHLGKKQTQKTHKSIKDYSRKGKSKRNWTNEIED